MPEQIFLQDKDVVLEFPDGTPDHIIQETIKREYPMTGEEVAGHMMVNPDWFNNDMTLDEYKRYREWKSEQSMGVGDFASAAGGAFKQVGGEVVGALGEMVTSPIQSAKAFPSAVGVGTLDIWNLGKQIVNHFKETDDTYEDFLAGRKDTETRRNEYDKQLEKDMAAERDKIQYFNQIREDLIKESDNPEFTRGASNVLDPTIFFGGFLGKQFAKAASKVAATATGKAASKLGRGMYQFGDKLGEVGESITETGSRAFTGATGVTPETGRALAVGTGIGGGVMTAGAPVVAGAYGATKGLQVGGRVLAEAGEGLQRGIGREGFFGGAAARLEPGSGAQRLAQGLSLTDPLLEYGAGAAGGMVAGGVVGMGLGGLADGWEGAASGLGGGMALGGVGGGIARGVEGVTGAALRAKRARDVDFYMRSLSDSDKSMMQGYIDKYGKDQAATIFDVTRIFRGQLGDASVKFINDPKASRGFVPDMKSAEGTPTLVINLAKADSHYTIGHELWHGLTKIEQLQPMADAIRTELTGMWSEGKLLQEGLIPEAQLEKYFNDYVKKLKPSERPSESSVATREGKAKYIVDEIAAEHMAMVITGKKGKNYDRMMRGFDTTLRKVIDEQVMKQTGGAINNAIAKLSQIGVTPGKSILFPDMDKTSPVVGAMMRDMVRSRKNLGELVEASDKTITTAIRKKDFKHHQAELEKLNMLKDDGKGGRVMKDDKDIAAEEAASDSAMKNILEKGGPDGMRIETESKDDGTMVEVIRGTRFSPEQISEIQANSTILPTTRQNVEAFNNAVENGLITDMTYYAATTRRKNRLTGLFTSKYSSGIKKSKRAVLPYTVEVSNAGNIFVRAIDWTKLWTDTANMSFVKKLGLWDNDHATFIHEFQEYLTNLASDDPVRSKKLFGQNKADFFQELLMKKEKGGSKYVKSFRLDRMDGLQPTGESAKMSEDAYQLSKSRFMPDEGTVRAEPDQTFKLGNEGVARFMPANDRVNLADYTDRNVIALAADRMGIGVVKVGPTGAKRELSIPAQGGRGFMNIFNGGGWAFSDQATASRFLKRLKEVADENGNAVVGITVQSQINHLKNQTGQLAYVEAMQAAIDAGAISKRAADSQVRAMSDSVLASDAASIKQTTKQKFRKIRNLSGLERAVKNKALNFADMEPLLKQMQRKALPIKEVQLKEMGMTVPDIARDIADPELADIPFGSVVALLEVNVKQMPEKNNFHHSYPYTVHGNALGYLNRFHNIADLSTEPRIRNKHGVSAQPLQTVMPVMDNILKTVETKEGISADPAARFMPDDSSYLDAVNRGDTATAQRMVDQAAKAAGLRGPFFRGDTPSQAEGSGALPKGVESSQLTYPNVIKARGTDSGAIYLTNNPEVARYFSESVGAANQPRQFYIDAKRTASVDNVSKLMKQHYLDRTTPRTVEQLKKGEFVETAGAGGETFRWNTATRTRHINVAREFKNRDNWSGNSLMKIDEARNAGIKDFWIYHGKDEGSHPSFPSLPVKDMPKTEKAAWDAAISSDHRMRAALLQEKEEGWLRNMNVSHLTPKEVSILREAGFDSAEGFDIQGSIPVFDKHEVAVFDPNQIKSADPITRDDAGNIIPLSERFQSGSDDIRFMPSGDTELNLVQQDAEARFMPGDANRGYVGYSMSVRAARAYSEGKLPKSKAAKELGIPVKLFTELFSPSEYHHTSSKFNVTDFYDMEAIREEIATDPKVSLKIRSHFKSEKKRSEWWESAVTAAINSMWERVGEPGVRAKPLKRSRNKSKFERMSELADKHSVDYKEIQIIQKGLLKRDLTESSFLEVLSSVRKKASERSNFLERRKTVKSLLPEEFLSSQTYGENQRGVLKRYKQLANYISDVLLANESNITKEAVHSAIPRAMEDTKHTDSFTGKTTYRYQPERGAVPNIRFMPDVGGQDALGMFSAAERATVDLKQEKGSASQMLAMIKKAGVKDEEIAELGLDKFLEGNRKVSKDEIIDHLVENQITVEETVLRGLHDFAAEDVGIGDISQRARVLIDNYRDQRHSVEYMREDVDYMKDDLRDYELEGLLKYIDYVEKNGHPEKKVYSPTKFGGYVEPGAVEGSYRELLLRLPEADLSALEAKRKAFNREMWEKYNHADPTGGDLPGWYQHATPEEKRTYRNLLGEADESRGYKVGHYGDYPNTLAHVRFNDRTSEYGKTLFLEEIQSDWHQLGRKKGYQGGETVAEVQKLAHADREKFYSGKGYESDAQWAALSERVKQWDEREAAAKGAIPDAPFKTSWHELAMKRMISYAAKHGYDAIAWTKGETQAARYNLSKQVKEIAVPSVEPNVRAVRIEPIGGNSFKLMVDNGGKVEGLYAAEQFTGKQLDEVIGKEIAEKVMTFESPGKLTGLDLEVGGKGMKGFYDRMLPKMKIWKKLGLKVEESGLGKEAGMPYNDMTTSQLRDYAYRNDRNGDWDDASRYELINVIKKWNNDDSISAHIVKLTPEVKAKVLDTGIARFMPDAAVPGAEKNSIGWSMLMSKAGNWRVYGPDGVLAGVAANKNRAEQIFRTKYKRELMREERLAK